SPPRARAALSSRRSAPPVRAATASSTEVTGTSSNRRRGGPLMSSGPAGRRLLGPPGFQRLAQGGVGVVGVHQVAQLDVQRPQAVQRLPALLRGEQLAQF